MKSATGVRGLGTTIGRTRNRSRAIATAAFLVIGVTSALTGGGDAHAVADPSATSEVSLPMFEGESGAWSPDSSLIAVPETKAISLYGLDGHVRRRLRGPGIGYFGFPCECSIGWTADGTRIQFVSQEEELDSDGSVVGSVAADGSGEEARKLGVPIGAAAWAPSGWPLIYVPDSRTITGVKGKLVGPRPDLWRLDGLDARPEKLIASPAVEGDPQFSPDATEITFTRERRRSSSLWLADADGTHVRRLVGSLLGPSEDAWSPDGRFIALSTFSRKKGDRRCHLYVLRPGGGPLRQIVKEETLPARPAWTPDGHWITFATFGGAIREIRPDGTGLHTIADFPGKEVRGLSWSPDGEHLAYSARTPPRSD